MRKETLKRLLALKIEVVETLIADMPLPIQSTIFEMERDLMMALNEVTSEFLETHPDIVKEKTDTSVESIKID